MRGTKTKGFTLLGRYADLFYMELGYVQFVRNWITNSVRNVTDSEGDSRSTVFSVSGDNCTPCER